MEEQVVQQAAGSGEQPVVAPDLRTRRRQETESLIHRAAVELFEIRGVKATTVEEIAARAGVSPRTFFRHFATKEHAALPGVARLRVAIDELELEPLDGDGVAQSVLRDVEVMLVSLAGRVPEEELRESRRFRRIIESHPELLGLAVAQEQEMVQRLRDRLVELGRVDRASAQLVAEVSLAVWRSAWDRWVVEGDAGTRPDPAEVHRSAWRSMRALLG